MLLKGQKEACEKVESTVRRNENAKGFICSMRGAVMKYFCSVSDRVGTCYHEFYKGEWDSKTFWAKGSILLHDDTHEKLGLCEVFTAILPDYDPFGETQVNQSQWEAILNYASQLDTEANAALNEAKNWVNNVFENEKVFTILGI